MPIILDNLENDLQNVASQQLVKTFSPKFFDKKLTGKGGSAPGLLSIRNNPVSVPKARKTEYLHYQMDKPSVSHNGATTIYRIPVNPIAYNAWDVISKMKHPDIANMTQVAVHDKNTNLKLYAKLNIHAFTMEETIQSNMYTGVTNRTVVFIPTYQLMLYAIADPTHPECKMTQTYSLSQVSRIRNTIPNNMSYEFTSNPIQDWNDSIAPKIVRDGFIVDHKAFMDYMLAYEVFESTEEQSQRWQEQMDAIMDEFFENVAVYSQHTQQFAKDRAYRYAETQVRYIMNYNIPLELYRNIYASITKTFTKQEANQICKQNLNLLLSDTLNNLDANKSTLQTFQTPNPAVPLPASVQKLSMEQTKAVKSTEPLILVQAGAGTGKSTLILGRIDYLIACGVAPADITVLSFTNAAADHITEKNPNVHSMTIARMIHEIYSANFTNHELSSLDTLLNSLEIYYPAEMADPKHVVRMFSKRIVAMMKNETNNFTDMNNFIEDNYDQVIDILNTIRQTSLELEIIICYQKIDSFTEPASIQSKFLIIDEVQDNSIFEFVYTLKYIDKHKESMFIVGDCSQTLYEFRASNPRALNILEGSGTFATYQLNINYRSNQEILDMANVLLQNIEANQYANIQLKANSRAQVTEQSFLDKVHFDYCRLNKITDFHDALPSIFARDVRPYINKCLARGEQIAILAFTRRDINAVQTILYNQFPNLNPETDIISLVPDKMFNTTVMSKFICKYWSAMQFAPAQNIMMTISHEIMAKLPYLTYNDQAAAPRIQGLLSQWRASEGGNVNAWYNEFLHGQITQDEFLNFIKDNMLQFEIRTNAVKQALLSERNQQAKQSGHIANAKFLLSTIHSAKGLEFDNVIVLYRNESIMDEDKKRMYYVAFTRAMKSEFILAYDTMMSPQIQMDYTTVLEALHATSPAPNSPLNQRPKNRRIKI